MSAIRVAVAGSEGKMGRTVCEAVEDAEGLELSGQFDTATGGTLEEGLSGADVMVDFTTPESALPNAKAALDAGIHVVVGTTGFDLADLEAHANSSTANAFVAPNFAIGAVLMMEFARIAARSMSPAEIIEFHHEGKLDRPSGTAARTKDLIEEVGGVVNEPIHSVRLPGLVAHQEVIFGGSGETLTVRHDSTDRLAFMPGVVLAVRRVGDLPDRFTVGLEQLLEGAEGMDQ
ncbi:MAG: 4-hydroxy-tetrahydrodipicolinate reductase [Solirubrobacterales bacterium]